MTSAAADRLFSRSLFWGWAIVFGLLLLPIASFNVADPFWCTVAVGTALLAMLACRFAEGRRRALAVAAAAVQLPTARRCSRGVYFFSLVTAAGAVLILIDQQSTLGDLSLLDLQQRYIMITAIANAGDRLGTGLSTIGTVLRSLVYVAIVAFVALSAQVRLRRYALPLLVLLVALVLSAAATASRTYLIFCVAVAVVAGVAVRHRVMRRWLVLLLGALAGVVFISITTQQRLEHSLGDLSIAGDYLTGFFDVELQWLGERISDTLGVPIMTLILYLSHSLPEFSKLVADESTRYALGGHSLYLVIGPSLRLLELPLPLPATQDVERLGMWWGMMGDLYLDFGVAFVAVYPLVVFLMVRASKSLGAGSLYALTVRCMTGAMLFASAYFGVLNTYSFSYLLLLGVASVHAALRRHPAALHSSPVMDRTYDFAQR